MKRFTSFNKKNLTKIIAIVLWLIVWHITAACINKPLLVPTPSDVAVRLSELIVTAVFWKTVFFSFIRMFLGFIAGVIIGVLFATISYISKTLHHIFYIPLSVIKATPVASFIILALLWIKDGLISAFITMLMVTPIIWTNVYEGLKNTDKKLLEMSKVFRFSLNKKIKYVYMPQIKSYFLAAVLTTSGLGWKAGIAAEVIARPDNAIGSFINDSKVYLETTDLFAWTIVVILISIFLEKIIKLILKTVMKNET